MHRAQNRGKRSYCAPSVGLAGVVLTFAVWCSVIQSSAYGQSGLRVDENLDPRGEAEKLASQRLAEVGSDGGGDGGVAGLNCPAAGSCCSSHANPGCNNEACCLLVCSIDAFCCETQWDSICADEAGDLCAVCGAVCGPACNKQNVECLDDSGLVNQYSNRTVLAQLRTPDGFPYCTAWIVGSPDCLITNNHCSVLVGDVAVFNFECDSCSGGSPKPTTSFTVTQVLASNAAQDWMLFRVAGNPAASFGVASVDPSAVVVNQAIYEIHHAEGDLKGFDDGIVTALNQNVPSCPGTILEHAVSVVSSQGASGSPVFRTDNHCVTGICNCGPPCSAGFMLPMSTIWPNIESAVLAAGCTPSPCGKSPVPNDNCTDAVPISNGATAFSNAGATTDGPTHPALCNFFGDPGIGADIWFNYQADCTGTVTVSLCGSGYDTEIAVYNGCSCPVGNGNLLACNDDSCGFQSQVSITVVQGNCYKIRVGGFQGAQGSGTITITKGPDCGGDVCAADISPPNSPAVCGDGNGIVDAADLGELLANWGPCPGCCADLFPVGSPDGVVGAGDLAQVLGDWGICP